MSPRRLLARLFALLNRHRAEREMNREIASHLALLEDDFQRRGAGAREARLAARRAFGGVEYARTLHRDARSFPWLEQAWQDLRHASRSLAKAPGFTAVAVATLALGIGVNTTLFTAYNAVALKPLPVADPQRVVRLERWFQSNARGDVQYAFSYPEYEYTRDHNSVFSDLVAASWPVHASFAGSQRVTGHLVSANYFAALGVPAMLGRTFLPEEDRAPGGNAVVVLSRSFWQRQFNGDTRVLGQVLKLNGTALTVVGVAPGEFTGTSVPPAVPDFWAPLSIAPQLTPGRAPDFAAVQLVARLKAGTSLKRAQAEADVVVRQFTATRREPDKTIAVTLQHAALFGNTEDPRFQALAAGLMLIVGMVLVVACANLANMLLARGASRRREIGLRVALGASRARVVRHLLTESLLLSLAGGATGLIMSIWTSRLLWVALRQFMLLPFAGTGLWRPDLTPDARILAYVAAVSVATGILFGLSPALQSTRPDLASTLKDDGASFGTRLTRSRLRSLLVGVQVTVSMTLLITAGLLARGLLRAQSADPGFETRRAFVLFTGSGNPAFKQRLAARLSALPEIRGMAAGGVPMTGTWTPPIVTAGPHPLSGRTLASYASDTYFDTLGIPIVRGRGFTRREAEDGPLNLDLGGRRATPQAQTRPYLAVISESTARRFWPGYPRGPDPIGQRFQLDVDFRGTFREFEVIGVVKDVRYSNLTRTDPAHVYLPTNSAGAYAMLLRVQSDSQRALAAVRSAVDEIDPARLPDLSLVSIEEGPLQLQRMQANAYALFAAILAFLALALAAVGIYGVMAYLVSRRAKEIGVRMALGATAGGVLRTVVLQGLRPVFAGSAVGMVAAAGLSWLLHQTLVLPGSADFLYGVPFYDPATFLGLGCFLTAVAVAASAVPARKAVSVDPVVALRHE